MSRAHADPDPGPRRARLRWAVGLAVVLAVWSLSGIRRIGERSFGVVDGLIVPGEGLLVDGGLAFAPPFVTRLQTYPSEGVELALPQAESARLPSADGSRYGLRGWITLRPRVESWRQIHGAAGGEGISGVLVSAVREALADLSPGAERGPVTATLSRDIERRLGEALGGRGVDLRRLDLDAFDFLTVRTGETGAPADETKLLVVGWDGGDWEIIDGLIAEGKLPNLKRLIERGVRAKLLSISPMLSPVIWTSMATGVEPSRHGILDFIVGDPADGKTQPVTSAQRQVPTVWEMLSRNGVETGVVGWWATWPADPLGGGYLVSDRIAYQLFGFEADPEDSEGKTWPPELYDDIRPWLLQPESIAWDAVVPYLEGPRQDPAEFSVEETAMLDQFRTLLASGETYLRISTELRDRFSPRLEVVYFEGTDTSAHLFMPFRKPELPGVDPAGIESFHRVVDRYYETADRYLGELLVDKDDSWTVMVVSDHGFASDATRPRSTDSRIGHGAAADWHRRFGMLVLSGAQVVPGAQLDETSIYDIAPTILALFGQPVPRSWPGRVLGRVIEPQFLERHPVRYRNDDPIRQDASAAALLDPAAEDLLSKLQSLGYISTTGGETGESATARNNAGVALLAEGRYEEAAEEFRAGLVATPDAPMLQLNLGLAMRLLGRGDEARSIFERAMRYPTTLRMAGHQLAQMALDRDDLATAEALLRDVLLEEPDASEIHNTLGLVLEEKGDLAGAQEEFERAAELDPDAALPRNNLGNLFKRLARLELAESWYQQAIEADPYFMGAYNNLALVYQGRGEMDRAIDLYNRALTKSPTNAIVLNNLASLYYARGEIDEAREMWRQSSVADPNYESPLNNLASLLINDGRFDEAENLLRSALELDGNYGDARINMAIVFKSRGDTEGAREQLRRSTEDPRSGIKAHVQWGLFELELGNNDTAVQVLENAGTQYPPLPAWLNPLGEAYARSGRGDRALEVWKRSLEVQPDQPRLRQVVESPTWLDD